MKRNSRRGFWRKIGLEQMILIPLKEGFLNSVLLGFPLRLTKKGYPTLSFKKSVVDPWFLLVLGVERGTRVSV